MYCMLGVKLVAIVLLFELSHCACPAGFAHRFGEKCFLFKESDANLAQNEDFCRKNGGTLASIGSKAENDYISNFLTKNTRYWIGLKRPKVGVAQFTWFDGSPVNYTNWGSFYPKHLSESQWGAFLNSGNGYWYDAPATNNFFQLCQSIDEDSKKLERVMRVVDQLVKGQEKLTRVVDQLVEGQVKLTRDFGEYVKQAEGRASDVTRNLTVALEKISNIDHRRAAVDTWNKTSNVHPRIVRIAKGEGIEIVQP